MDYLIKKNQKKLLAIFGVLLIGTPEEVRRELRSRIEDFGMTYFIVFPRSDESRDLLVKEIMPEFTSRA